MAAIKKVVTDSRTCVLAWDRENHRWIGDGPRFYAMDEDIPMEKSNALAILDVDKAKREKCAVMEWASSDPRMSIYPNQETDERLIPVMAVMYAGEPIMLFASEKREIFAISQGDLAPIASKHGYEYALRRRKDADGGEMRPAVIVMADMFVGAVLMPMSAKATKIIIDNMARVATGEAVEYGDDEEAEFAGETAEE